MPKPVAYDLSQIDAHIIAYSDRVQRGTKEDRATPACVGALTTAGLGEVTMADYRSRTWCLSSGFRLGLRAKVAVI